MPIKKEMLASKWGEFVELDGLDRDALRDGRFSVVLDEARFECLLARKDAPYLFVPLSGARDPERHQLPKFDRWTWADSFPGSVLYISDPTLYLAADHLRLGWYVGTSKHNWMKSMASLVTHIAGCLGLLKEQIVTYGSSAGGFAALMLAAELSDATAVAINPQMDICRYWPRFVGEFLDVSFGGRSPEQLTPAELARLSVTAAFRRSVRAKCIVAQNCKDRMHYVKHYLPFCKAFNVSEIGGKDPSGRINSLTFEIPKGHGSEPKELAPQLIRQALALAAFTPTPTTGGMISMKAPDGWESKPADRIRAGHIYLVGNRTEPIEKWNGRSFAYRPRADLPEHLLSLPLEWDDDPLHDPNWRAQLHMWRMFDRNLIMHDKSMDASWLDFPLAVIRDWHRYHHVESRVSHYAWMDMMVGLRAMKLAYIMSQARHGQLQVGTGTVAVFNDLVESHLAFLLDHANVLYTNHTFSDLQGAAALAQVVDGQKRAAIYEFLGEVLPKLLGKQFSGHGVHQEHSPGYQSFGMNWLKRLRNSGWFRDFGLDELIAKTEDVLNWFRMPDGRILPFGDTDGEAPDTSVTATAFQAAGEIFNSSGYVIYRDDGGGDVRRSSYFAVMGACNSRHHKQADDLTLIWFEGEDILCDAGKFAYKRHPFRGYAESTRSHNTVEIDGKSYDLKRPYVYGSAIDAVVAHDWGYQIGASVRHPKFNVKHLRCLMYCPGEWLLVIDRMTGEKEHDFTQWFHFAPALPDLQKSAEGYHTRLLGGRRLRISAVGSGAIVDSVQKGVTDPRPQGWVSQSYGRVTPSCALGNQQHGRDVVFATLLTLDDRGSTIVLEDFKDLMLHIVTTGKGRGLRILIGEHSCDIRKA